MAQLTYTIEELNPEGQPPATLVALSGSVDPESIETFDNIFDELIDAGKNRIIIDFGKLKYINSTGMGILVQYNDSLEEEGGGMVLMNIHPKVLIVLEMLGLQELFQIVASVDESLEALAGVDVIPAEVQVKLDIPKIDISEEEPAPAPAAPAVKQKLVRCGSCGAMLSTPMPGGYKCPRCSAMLKIDDEGKADTYALDADGVIEMVLPPQTEFVSSVAPVVEAIGKTASIGDPSKVAQCVVGCLDLLAKHALSGKPENGQLHLFLVGSGNGLKAHVFCAGKAITSEESFAPFKANVETLKYEAKSSGNLLTLEAK